MGASKQSLLPDIKLWHTWNHCGLECMVSHKATLFIRG